VVFSQELYQYHYLAHKTTLIRCRILRVTLGYCHNSKYF